MSRNDRIFALILSFFIFICNLGISFSSEYIYGIHYWSSSAKSAIMNDKTGWVVEIVNVAGGPGSWDWFYNFIQRIRNEGVFEPIVRINYNWGETIPADPSKYDTFASYCAEVAYELYNRSSVKWFQIGNEMNLDWEYPPSGDGKGCPAEEYVKCFRKVYTAIKNRVPNVYVLVGPVGPFNNQGPLYSLSGNGVYYDVYFDYIVNQIGNSCDGYAIHPYGLHSEREDNNLQLSIVKGISNSWGFNCFKVYMKILQQYDYAKTKPVHATETNTFHGYGGDEPAYSYDDDVDWLQTSFQKIDDWNNNKGTSAGENPHGQKILSLCWFVYRSESPWELFALENDIGALPEARRDFSWVTQNTAYKHNFGSPPPPPPSGNNASLVSEDVPRSMVKGSTVTVHIRMKNTGSTTWTESSDHTRGHRLAAGTLDSGNEHNNEFIWKNFVSGGYSFSETNQRCFVSGSVAPNSEFTFQFDIVAPQSVGTKYFEAHMVEDGGSGWFGPAISIAINVTDVQQINDAKLISHNIPSSMMKGSTVTVQITMENTGTTTWTEDTVNHYRGHRLAAGTRDSGNPHNNEFMWKNFLYGGYAFSPLDARCFVSGSITPGSRFTFQFDIVAPTSTGTKYFEARMVEDGEGGGGWFGPVIEIPITVTDTSPQQDTTPPGKVSDLTAHPGNNAGEVILSWTAPGDDGYDGTATQYDIRFYNFEITDSNWSQAIQLANPPQPQAAGTRQTWTIPSSAGLTPGATYYFALRARDEMNNWSPVSNSPFTYAKPGTQPPSQDTTPPGKVNDLAARPGNNAGEVVLSWTAPGDDGHSGTAAQYDIRFFTFEITDNNWSQAIQLANPPQPQAAGTRQTWTIPSSAGLTPGATYYFALRARDEMNNWSPVSNSPFTYAKPGTQPPSQDTTPPGKVNDLAARPGNNAGEVVLSWTAPGDDGHSGTAAQYDIRFFTFEITDNNWSQAIQLANPPQPQSAGTQQVWTIPSTAGLTPGATYYFALRARDEMNNWSPVSNSPFTYASTGSSAPQPDNTPPSPIPTLLKPEDNAIVTSLPIIFKWTASEDLQSPPVSYELQISNNQNFQSPISISCYNTEYLLTSLPEGKYWWRVRAKDSATPNSNATAWSKERSFTLNISGGVDGDEDGIFPREKFVTKTISLTFPSKAKKVIIMDINGNVVATLDKELSNGLPLIWDGKDSNNTFLNSGVYIYKIIDSNGSSFYGTVVLVK